ncbi:MAG: hypothetical protein JXN59_03600 [Anaerolineae bacterium]|nr:hypothetical protein [Anaerolineae bacterium]
MTIRQHYYTSCRTQEKAGFQTKAATPGIPSRTQETLLKLIDYRPPTTIDPRAIDQHPVSLRFFTPSPAEAMLICAQPNGPDEFGRPGNFFAHSLIGPVEAFMEPLAPIFYWQSPFWVRADDSTETALPVLDSLAGSARTTFDYDAIWPFLTARRRDWFYALFCAVLDYPASKRRVVIADSAEHAALWIAALTMALPYQHRALLTFATYHHDPYNAPFLVTGTTPDSSFRFTADDYRKYFVLNTAEGRVSSAPDSEFAQFVCDRFTTDQYETEVLDLFMLLKRRVPGDTPDPARLGTLTRFSLLQSGSVLFSSAQARETTHAIITEITGSRKLDAADIQDLRTAWELVADDLLETHDPALLPDFLAALERLSKIDPDFDTTCPRACAVFGLLIVRGQIDAARPLGSLLHAAYAPDVARAAFSAPDNLAPLIRALGGHDPARLRAFWEFCGPLIAFEQPETVALLAPAFQRTLDAADHAALQTGSERLNIPAEVAAMLEAWLHPQKTINAVTSIARQFHAQRPDSPVYAWVYYAWIAHTPLEGRRQIREIYSEIDPTIVVHELQRDLLRHRGNPAELARMLGAWAAHVPSAHREGILAEALRFLWGREDVNRAAFAEELLRNAGVVALLDDSWQVRLLEAGIKTLELTTPDPSTLALYQQLLERNPQELTPELRSPMQGAVSLATGVLHEGVVDAFNQRFAAMPPEEYRASIITFVERFFAAEQPPDAHGLMAAAAYVLAHRTTFWEVYWAAFQRVLLEEENQQVCLHALDLWFKNEARLASLQPLLPADFFLGLVPALERLQEAKGYNKIAREFEEALGEFSWAALLPELKKSRGILRGWR